jgi:hypothetical protein
LRLSPYDGGLVTTAIIAFYLGKTTAIMTCVFRIPFAVFSDTTAHLKYSAAEAVAGVVSTRMSIVDDMDFRT